jgi:hypothetical protein
MKNIYSNEYFVLQVDKDTLYLTTTSKEIQEKYEPESVMSQEEKVKRIDLILEYFYNFWKLQENTNDIYTLKLDINLIMIEIPWSHYLKVKKTLDSLKEIFTVNLKETNIIVKNNLTKYFLKVIFQLYTPVKPVNIV